MNSGTSSCCPKRRCDEHKAECGSKQKLVCSHPTTAHCQSVLSKHHQVLLSIASSCSHSSCILINLKALVELTTARRSVLTTACRSHHTPPHCPALLQITHNSYHLRFELPGGASANMPVASCLLTKASLKGPADEKPKVVVRPYTPVSAPDAAGHLDLVIKAYPTGTAERGT